MDWCTCVLSREMANWKPSTSSSNITWVPLCSDSAQKSGQEASGACLDFATEGNPTTVQAQRGICIVSIREGM